MHSVIWSHSSFTVDWHWLCCPPLLFFLPFSPSPLPLTALSFSISPPGVFPPTRPSIFPSSVSARGQRRTTADLQPWGSRSHDSGWVCGRHFTPPISLPQPPCFPPYRDRLHGNSLFACHGAVERQQQRRSEAHLPPGSFSRRRQPHEPDLVPRGNALLKPRLFLLLQRSPVATLGRDHGWVIGSRRFPPSEEEAVETSRSILKSDLSTSPLNQSHLSVWSIAHSSPLSLPAEVYRSQKEKEFHGRRGDRKREAGWRGWRGLQSGEFQTK